MAAVVQPFSSCRRVFLTIALPFRQLTHQLITAFYAFRILGTFPAECRRAELTLCLQPAAGSFRGRYWPVRRPVSPCGNRKPYGSFNALTPMSDDDIKNVIMPAASSKPTGTALVAYYASTLIPSRRSRSTSDQCAVRRRPYVRVITFYGEPMNWRQMANLPYRILRPICARYAVRSGTTRRNDQGNRAPPSAAFHFRPPRGHYSCSSQPA